MGPLYLASIRSYHSFVEYLDSPVSDDEERTEYYFFSDWGRMLAAQECGDYACIHII
ncbi:hypothetical protein KIPB_015362, partial [Kipferlia bialata]|eukprot:g15362.t1